MIKSRQEIIEYALSFPNSYFDVPFDDPNWQVVRHRGNKKVFVWTFEKDGNIWINLKCRPEEAHFLRQISESVIPAYHMNKVHWNSVILDGKTDDELIKSMIDRSYDLTKPKLCKKATKNQKQQM